MVPSAYWLSRPPQLDIVETPTAHITVLRDDVLEGGSKMRFLPFLVEDAEEITYGGPFCGGAAHALSVYGREASKKVTLFYATSKHLHLRQIAARKNGANLKFVRPGYMTVVQKRARDYAQEAGALFLPLGFDVPAAIDPLTDFAEQLHRQIGDLDQVWCCVGSGMLARIIGRVFNNSQVMGIGVGLQSKHGHQPFTDNVTITPAPIPFRQQTSATAPFPSCGHYDRKAWAECAARAQGRILFWNVAGPC